MESRITATDLAKSLSDVLNRVRYRGEKFIVERNGASVAALIPVWAATGITLRELMIRLAQLPSADDGFAKDLTTIQSSQSKLSVPARDN